MKKIIILSIVAVALAFSFSSCTTYEEGPGFTILPADVRIQGSWNMTQLYINDELQENSDLIIEFTFNSDGTGTRTTELVGFSAETVDIDWEFNEDKTYLKFKDTDETEWDDVQILRLTNKELWIVDDAGIFGIWQFRYEKV